MAEDFGYGQQTPADSTDDFNATCFLVRQMMARLDTAKLVQVKAVTGGGHAAASGTVDVLPLVNQIDGQGNKEAHGTVFGIPWFRLQGGKCAVILDPVAGDIGYVVAMDRDSSVVKETREQGNPGSNRSYNIADGVYVGAVLGEVPEQYIEFTTDAVRFVDKTGNVVEMKSTGIHITPASGQDIHMVGNLQLNGSLGLHGTIQALNGGVYQGSLQIAGDITCGYAGTPGSGVGFLSHTHAYNRPTGGSTVAQTGGPQD